jgi:uncharacterized protein (DUF2267 family)
MDVAELYDRVAARLPDEFTVTPEALTMTVLSALADRLSPEEAAELGAELPVELGDLLAGASGDGTLERDEFIESLAAQLDIDDDEAEAGASAVLIGVREYLEPMVSIDQVLALLPRDLAQMMHAS